MAIGRPRVEIREFDQTASIETFGLFQVGLAGFAQKGPVDVPVLITNKQQYTDVFGTIGWGSDLYESKSYLGYAVDFYLDEGNAAYIVRGDASGSRYAYVDIASGAFGTTYKLSATSSFALHGDGNNSALTATSASATPPSAAALRVYSKYKGGYANNANNIVVFNYNFFSAASASVTGNAIIPNIDYRPNDYDEFYLAVYTSAGVLLEEYIASTTQNKKNARGDNIFIEYLVNNNSKEIACKVGTFLTGGATSSSMISTFDWTDYSTNSYSPSTYATNSAASAYTGLLSGNYNLASAGMNDLQTSIEALNNVNEYVIRGIGAPGATWTDGNATISKVKTVSENRGDCVGFIDLPRDSVQNNVGVRTSAGIDSTWVTTYSNWFEYYDGNNDQYLYLPPTIQAYRAVARTWNNYGFFYAPAGRERGGLVDVTKLDYQYTPGDLDILAMNQINPLARLKNEGNVIWGQKTTYGTPSDFRDLNIRFLFITVEQAIADFARSLIFRFNNAQTRGWAALRIDGYLKNIIDLGGIESYTVVCDSTNNPDAVVNANELVIDTYIKATKVAEVIKLNFTATRDAVNIIRST